MERKPLKAFLDTHAAVFLWEGRAEAFGSSSRELLPRASLLVSPFVRLELCFLREVGKLEVDVETLLGDLASDIGVVESDEAVADIVRRAQFLDWTRDPFDRLLVATALAHDAPFVTRDRTIRQHYPAAIW